MKVVVEVVVSIMDAIVVPMIGFECRHEFRVFFFRQLIGRHGSLNVSLGNGQRIPGKRPVMIMLS